MADTDSKNNPDWRMAAAAEYAERRASRVRDRDNYLKQADKFTSKAKDESAAIEALDAAARAFGIEVIADPFYNYLSTVAEALGSTRTGPLFKDVALQLLKDAYPDPLRAAEIQEKAEAKLGRKFHPKTPGMSLYRLAKEGEVERKGWDWFYKPEQPEIHLEVPMQKTK